MILVESKKRKASFFKSYSKFDNSKELSSSHFNQINLNGMMMINKNEEKNVCENISDIYNR